MKEIAVVGLTRRDLTAYVEQLSSFFDDRISFRSYLATDRIDVIEGDVILMSSHLLVKNLTKKLANQNADVIHISSTFSKSDVEKLHKIPSGAKVLVATPYKGLTYDCIEQFKIIENGLEYIPYFREDENLNMSDFSYAIVHSSSMKINIDHVIRLDVKKIHPHIYKFIIDKYFKEDKALAEKINWYQNTLINTNFSLDESSKIINEWDDITYQIADSFDKGVILLDENNVIKDYNYFVCKLFGIQKEQYENKSITEIPLFKDIFQKIETIGEKVSIKYYHETIRKPLIISKFIIQFHSINYMKMILISNPDLELENCFNHKNNAKFTFSDIICESDIMKKCISVAQKVANSNGAILLLGETGTGKELFAHAIHNYSHRKEMPFIAINCAAFNESLLESELFGYEPGTFTGALKSGKKGIFEMANGGTVFLDEIGDAPLSIQSKLLRVLQEKEIRRIGGTVNILTDIRIISATNMNLSNQIENGTFRKDLYYRLNTFHLNIPPLRSRKEDIPKLIHHLLKQSGYGYKEIKPDVLDVLIAQDWDGNVRELKSCVEYFCFMSDNTVTLEDLPEQYLPALPTSQNKLVSKEHTSFKIFKDLSNEDNKLCRFVIETLFEKSIGRNALLVEAAQFDLQLSEHHLKRILKYLSEKEVIMQSKGRKGAALTELGVQLYETLEKDVV